MIRLGCNILTTHVQASVCISAYSIARIRTTTMKITHQLKLLHLVHMLSTTPVSNARILFNVVTQAY